MGWRVTASDNVTPMMRRIAWALLCVTVASGCGPSKTFKAVAPPQTKVVPPPQSKDVPPPPNATAEVLDPPGNIDVKSCAELKRGSKYDLEPIEACGDCCGKHGFTIGTFEYKDVCTCGKSREPANEQVCSTPTALASSSNCETCCKNSAYRGHNWASGMGLTSCSCEGRTEEKACAGRAERESCWVCCYNAGYFGVKWTAPSTCLCAG